MMMLLPATMADKAPTITIKPTRTHWYESEIELLFDMRARGSSWEQIAEHLNGRTTDAVRLEYHRRWTPEMQQQADARAAASPSTDTLASNATRPRTFWTPEEDRTLLAALKTYGRKWRKILALLPGRTDSSVRNRAQRLEQLEAAGMLEQSVIDGGAGGISSNDPPAPQRSVSVGTGLAPSASCIAPRRAEQMLPPTLPHSRSVDDEEMPPPPPRTQYYVPTAEQADPPTPRITLDLKEGSQPVPPLFQLSDKPPPPRRPSLDDSSRSRTEMEHLTERSRDSRRCSELDEWSAKSSALDELSATLRSLGLVSGYTGSQPAATCDSPVTFSLDELCAIVGVGEYMASPTPVAAS